MQNGQVLHSSARTHVRVQVFYNQLFGHFIQTYSMLKLVFVESQQREIGSRQTQNRTDKALVQTRTIHSLKAPSSNICVQHKTTCRIPTEIQSSRASNQADVESHVPIRLCHSVMLKPPFLFLFLFFLSFLVHTYGLRGSRESCPLSMQFV